MKPYGLTGSPLTCKYGCCFENENENKIRSGYLACRRASRKKARQQGVKEIKKELDNDSET